MEDPRIISALFISLKMAYYNVLINTEVCGGNKKRILCACDIRLLGRAVTVTLGELIINHH